MIQSKHSAAITFVLLLLFLTGCKPSHMEERSDVPDFYSFSEYGAYMCPFCKTSRLPKPNPKAKPLITENHPILAKENMHMAPLLNGVIRTLYGGQGVHPYRHQYETPAKVAQTRFEQGSENKPEYPDIIFYMSPYIKWRKNPQDHLRTVNPEAIRKPIAKDALVFFVHRDNPVETLTLEQIRGIYSGEISRWNEVGGRGGAIKAFQRQTVLPMFSGNYSYSLSQDVMREDVMAGRRLMRPDTVEKTDIVGHRRIEVVEYTNSPEALGYGFRWSVMLNTAPRRLKQIKLLSVDGISPTEENIRAGLYPLTYDFNVLAPKRERTPETETVINWLTGSEGREYLRRMGYVPY